MRIGLFTDTYPPYINGVSTSVEMLKNALEKLGHTVYVVTINDSAIKYHYDEKKHILRMPGIPIGIYDYRLSQIYPLKAINRIKDWKLDIIHSNTEFSIGIFARLFAKQFHIPLVHTYHTWYEDYVYYLTKGHFDKSSKKVIEHLTKFYCETTATELIVPTKKICNLFKNKYKFEKNINIIPTGIEIERFYKEKIDKEELIRMKRLYKINKKDFIIIFVGRLAEEKNIKYILDVQKELCSKYKNIKMIIVGDGPNKEEYENYTKDIKIEDNIIFTGRAAWEDMPTYYHMADVFITASKSETQGLTVIESMASSIVPCCIQDESFTETVVDDFNGILFNTKEEAVNKIIEIYLDEKKRIQLSNQARISSEQCSSKYFATSVLDVYKRAINEKKKNSKNIILNLINRIKGE